MQGWYDQSALTFSWRCSFFDMSASKPNSSHLFLTPKQEKELEIWSLRLQMPEIYFTTPTHEDSAIASKVIVIERSTKIAFLARNMFSATWT